LKRLFLTLSCLPQIAEKLFSLYGDGRSSVLVRSLRSDPFVVSWCNQTLVTHECPRDEILALFKSMVAGSSHDGQEELPSRPFAEHFEETAFGVKNVRLVLSGSCTGALEGIRNNPGKASSPAEPWGKNSIPLVRNPISRINVTAGEMLRYKVPEVMLACTD
jgi:hypothetical protein